MPRTLTESELNSAAGPIRSYDAVVVVGAGMSAYGFPMTRELPALVWQGLDSSPEALAGLRAAAGRGGTAKELLEGEPVLLAIGWSLIRQFDDAREAFQMGFANLDADRDPSSAHRNLARMIHAGRVECVISFNWDTCLERAYEQTFGVPIPEGTLFKPHGDAAVVDGEWILPDEDGIVTQAILDKVRELSNRPRTLMVVGYSSSDEAVVEQLIAPLAGHWPVVRIGPSATGEGALPVGADVALELLARAIGAHAPLRGWRFVTFDRSRDFSAALRGERLRPVDVDACPELPAARRLSTRLRSSKFAAVSGPSGSGKSITAFHAARHLNLEGWAVVERRGEALSSGHIEEFATMEGPVLAVVDDAQAVDAGLLEDLRAVVSDDHAVLLVSTVRLDDRSDETLVASQAQQVIYDFCMQNLNEVGALISQLDDRVQWSAFAPETPETRLRVAHRTASEPWLFMFIASGGEQRIAGALDRVVDDIPAAIVLSWTCILQMTSRDAGATREELQAWLERVAPDVFGSPGEFRVGALDSAIALLKSERLIGEQEGRIRAAHIRIADRALYALGLRHEHGIGGRVLGWIRLAFLDSQISLGGKFWLFRTFDRSEAYRRGPIHRLADAEVASGILEQLRSGVGGPERGAGLHLLWSIDFVRTVPEGIADGIAELLVDWLPDVQSEEVIGFRWILSGLRSSHPEAYEFARAGCAPRLFAESLSRGGSRRYAPSWADLIREVSPNWSDPNYASWVAEFESGIDGAALESWLCDLEPESHVYEIWELLSALAELSPETAGTAMRACKANIVSSLEADLAEAASNFGGWAFGIMFVVARMASRPSAADDDEDDDDDDEVETRRQAETDEERMWIAFEPRLSALSEVVLDVMESVDWEASANSLAGKRAFELHSLDILLFWLGQLSAEILDRVAAALPPDWLYEITAGDSRPGEPMLDRNFGILQALAGSPGGSAVVRSFLEEHDAAITTFPPRLISRFADIATVRLRQSRQVGIAPPTGHWKELRTDIEAIHSVDPEMGRKYLHQVCATIGPALSTPNPGSLKGVGAFINSADLIDESLLSVVFGGLTPGDVEESWRRLAVANPAEIGPVLTRAMSRDSPISELAREIWSVE